MSKAEELSSAFGFLHLAEVKALVRIAGMLPEDPVVVNIGAGVGTSALAVAEARPDAKIVTVDISPGGPHGGHENERNAFRNANMDDRLPEQVLGDSKEIGRNWKRDAVDFVFVDGDHSEEGVRGDIESWLPHVKDGGMIAFHDYSMDVWPKVTTVVDEVLNGYEVVDHTDTIITFRIDNGNGAAKD